MIISLNAAVYFPTIKSSEYRQQRITKTANNERKIVLLSMYVRMSGIAHSLHSLFVFKRVSMLSTTTFKTRIKTMNEKKESEKKAKKKKSSQQQTIRIYQCPVAAHALFILACCLFIINTLFAHIVAGK